MTAPLRPLDRDFENLVDCLFLHLKMNGYAPNRQWVKITLHQMELFTPEEFTKKLSLSKSPSVAFEEAYKTFVTFYIDYIASLSLVRMSA